MSQTVVSHTSCAASQLKNKLRFIGLSALSSQRTADRDMRYLKSYNTRARSALLGKRNTLRKQDIEVDVWRFNDTHPVKCSFSLKMRFLPEVRTLIAMGISLLCVLLCFHSEVL